MNATSGRPEPKAGALLEQIAERALDDDYYVVRTGPQRRVPALDVLATTVMVAIFGLLVAVTAVQTHRDRPASSLERETLIADIEFRQRQLDTREARVAELRDEVEALQASAGRIDPALERLRMLTGDLAVSGPGIRIEVAPSLEGRPDGVISDVDLQGLVNALWLAGAEAIALNDNRIGALSSIRTAGGAITVNFRSIGPPYVLTAIGSSSSLGERFEAGATGRYWESRRRAGAVGYTLARVSGLTLPATLAHRTAIAHATTIEGES